MKAQPKQDVSRGVGGLLRTLNIFRTWSITQKLSATMVILLLGFGGVVWAYASLVTVQDKLEQRAAIESDLTLAFEEARAALLNTRSSIEQFDLDPSDELWAVVTEEMALAQEKIAELESIEQTDEQRAFTLELKNLLASIETKAVAMEELARTIGFEQDVGLQGELREHARSLEELTAGNRELEYWMLQMRRHEKDYIARGLDKYVDRMGEAYTGFLIALSEKKGFAKGEDSAGVQASLLSVLDGYVDTFSRFVDTSNRAKQQLALIQEDITKIAPLVASTLELRDETVAANKLEREAEVGQVNRVFVAVLAITGVVTILALIFLALGMTRSLGRLRGTVQQVTQGNMDARCAMTGGDELAQLGNAFDTMLEERVSTLSEVERERDALNDSVINLMGTVAQLSQKDLTVKAPVAEDVTGPVSDAVNLMASETTKVLNQIREVSQQVEQAANTVRDQANKVSDVASRERQLVQDSANGLKQAGVTMTQLAQEAKGANETADAAMNHTREARQAVSTTVNGIDQIREIIRETEKRIKRLGERSQEITGAVNLINTIAERTHILALNASMHAASAGEAGRGFAVVADEVQRLAESSREATSDISSMVNAIRVETADTVDTMNRVIAQVAEGTRLAQQAGARMEETETTTAELVAAVAEIARAAEQQARSALELMERSEEIVQTTQQTSQELEEQSAHTVQLVTFSNTLRESVGVFKLPAAAA